jgi:hypothetical protein
MIGDEGDSRFIMSLAEYNYLWLTGHYSDYWDGFFMFPDREVITYSDNLLGSIPFYAAFRMVTEMHTAFQLTLLLAHVLNFLAAYYALTFFSRNRFASAAGAFIFAFGLALCGLHNHPQYLFRFCIPLFFCSVVGYLKTYSPVSLGLAFLFLLWQFYLVIYIGFFLLLSGSIFCLTYCAIQYKSLRISILLKHFLAFIPAALLMILPLWLPYHRRMQTTGYYSDYDFYMQTIPRPLSWFRAFPGSCWKFLSGTDVSSQYPWLHNLFPGFVVVLSIPAIFYFLRKSDHVQLAVVISLVIILCFVSWSNGHTLYGYLMKFSPLKSVRFVGRIVTVLVFFFSVILTFTLSEAIQKFNFPSAVLVLFSIALIADNFTDLNAFKTFSKEGSKQQIAALYKDISLKDTGKSAAFAYLSPGEATPEFKQLDAMLCALKMRKKTVNGYSSTCHKDFGPFWKKMDRPSLQLWCDSMHTDVAGILIVNKR